MVRRWFGFWVAVVVLNAGASVCAQGMGVAPADSGQSEPGGPVPIPLPAPEADYFPVGAGLNWTYGGSPMEIARLVELSEAEETPDGPSYLWDGFQDRRTVRREGQKLFELQDGAWRLLFDFGAEAGASWTVEGSGEDLLDGTVVTVESRSAAVRVPYGAYENGIHLVLRPHPGLADAGVVEMWFVPWVGLVKWTEITIAGPQTYELARFAGQGGGVAGRDPDSTVVEPTPVDPFPMPPFPAVPFEDFENRAGVEREGVNYEIGTDREAYGQDETVFMVYRVTAVGQDSVTFHFGSTQQIDFRLTDASGETVWVWSATRSFLQVLTEFTLKRGESRAFRAVLNVGEIVAPEGSYSLTGFMPTARFEEGAAAPEETEARTKFVIGREGAGGGTPPPDPPPGLPAGRGLQAGLQVDVAADSLVVHYRLVNTTEEPLRLMYRSGQQYDLVLEGPAGEVWRWSDGRGFHDALWEQVLEPGDSIVVREAAALPGAVGEGVYVLRGFLTVRADAPGAVAREETEAVLKFRAQAGEALRVEMLSGPADSSETGGVVGDFNGDGWVTFADFVLFAGAYGKASGSPAFDRAFDLDADGAVGFRDFVLFARAFGN